MDGQSQESGVKAGGCWEDSYLSKRSAGQDASQACPVLRRVARPACPSPLGAVDGEW